MESPLEDFLDDEIFPFPFNPLGVVAELGELIKGLYPGVPVKNAGSCKEKLIASELKDYFLTLLQDYRFEEDDELYLNGSFTFWDDSAQLSEDDSDKENHEAGREEDGLFLNKSPDRLPKSPSISSARKREIVRLWDANPSWKWTTLKSHGAKEIPNKKTAFKWRQQVHAGINKMEKYKVINDHVYQQLSEARKVYKIIRSSHLRTWAIQKFLEINDSTLNFKAGKSWVDRFKRAHKISSRKINRLVSKREIKSEKEILQAAKNFQNEIIALTPRFDKDFILNTDQCGFSYEITSSRTLTSKGEKIVCGYSQSPKNLSTHSYTVQYIISMSGKIFGNVFLCLQEPSGKFGPRVKEDVESYLPSNVTITCSTSGKLSTSLNEYFLEKQVVPHVTKDFLWIIDSWGGHTNVDSYNKFFGESNGRQARSLHKSSSGKMYPHCATSGYNIS